jgi:homoserine O-acetyltransferase
MKEAIFQSASALNLESGQQLTQFSLSYTTYGQLNADRSNVIWVVHALTGDSHAAQWWSGLVAEDAFYAHSDYYIVCANLLGSAYGSTNALSIDPSTGIPYFYSFPQLSTRDHAQSLDRLRAYLGIDHIHTVIGGSLGGQIALELAILLGDRVRHAVLIASAAKTSPWVIGFNEAQRMAIAADSSWGERIPEAGKKGMEAARAIAMLSYRHPTDLNFKQKETEEKLDGFLASSYLRYQGTKLAQRFNAFSYWSLTKSMDSHDVGRARGGLELALQRISANVLVVGVGSDLLFLPEESKLLSTLVVKGVYREVESHVGHDAFLIEFGQLATFLKAFYEESQ